MRSPPHQTALARLRFFLLKDISNCPIQFGHVTLLGQVTLFGQVTLRTQLLSICLRTGILSRYEVIWPILYLSTTRCCLGYALKSCFVKTKISENVFTIGANRVVLVPEQSQQPGALQFARPHDAAYAFARLAMSGQRQIPTALAGVIPQD